MPLAVSGWADGYSNAVFRLVEHLDSPVRGLVGPWSHTYPHMGKPGPAIGFLDECLRWWDHWLKGEDQGVENDPALRAWMQDSVPPTSRNWLVTRDLENDVSTLTVVKDEGRVLYDDVNLEVFEATTEWYSSCADEFDSARGEVVTEIGVQRGDWKLRTCTRTVLTATETDFHLRAELDAWEGGIRVHSNNWDRTIPRRLV